MPLGDSITFDWHYSDSRNDTQRHGYRNHLWHKLKNAKHAVDFVGTLHNGSAVRPSFDGHHQGYTGYTTHQIASLVYSKLQATSPDIILLHIGTNDSMSYDSSDMTGLEKILDKIDLYEKNYHKNITVILARIIPLPKAGSWVTNFNSALDSMVARRVGNGDDIIKVNMNTINSLIDGIHPTNSGYSQMASIWFNALKKPINDRNNHAYLIPVYGLLLQ
jgi:lysophospholipase L1-like esterase